jgi:uncharacterized Zn finger protein
MTKRRKRDPYAGLTWEDILEWVGESIAFKGSSYQRTGKVLDLVVTRDWELVAWVTGTSRYATVVSIDGDDGYLSSRCSCPVAVDCKHGAAVLVEYLESLQENISIPEAPENDERLRITEEQDGDRLMDEEPATEEVRTGIASMLGKKKKSQLIALLLELAEHHPEIAGELSDSWQSASGNVDAVVTRLRGEIRALSPDYDPQDRWEMNLPSPDIAGIRRRLAALLAAGHADEVLSLGRELIAEGKSLVEMYDDDGEAGAEVATCYPILVSALDQSSLEPADRLEWAVNVALEDEFNFCDVFVDYLDRDHGAKEWSLLSDRLLRRLDTAGSVCREKTSSRDYERDRLSDMVLMTLERAGRTAEIMPLCKAEATVTGSYERLVRKLLEEHQYDEAERWILKGVHDIGEKRPGIADGLRNSLREIQIHRKNWPMVAAMRVDDFVISASERTYADCRKAVSKVGLWPQVRENLLAYLESGAIPWEQKDWPLPEVVLPRHVSRRRENFPMIAELIDVAIFEKTPERVLLWYDRLPKTRYGFGTGSDERIARAVADFAPGRAVAIWKDMAEREIAQTKPKAYRVAVRYLQKAEQIMILEKKAPEWKQYLLELRRIHARKRKLIEALKGLEKNDR